MGKALLRLDPNEKLFSQGQHPLLHFIQGRIEPKAIEEDTTLLRVTLIRC